MPGPGEPDRDGLARAVAAAVGRPRVRLGEWHCASIHEPFNQSTGGLYRLSGNAHDGTQRHPWSLVLKVVRRSAGPFGGSADPADPNYWQREPLLFQAGVLTELPGIRAPRCYGIDTDEDTAHLWLEDVVDGLGPCWTDDLYARAAERLGAFNGAYLADRATPTSSHLSQNWLRALVATYVPAFDRLGHEPLVDKCWPGELKDRVLALWARRCLLLDALDAAPQTFCHLDAHPRNLLVDPDRDDLVAVDWSYSGLAPVGSDLAALVLAGVCLFDEEPERLGQLDNVVFDGYLAGLRRTGWRGDEHVVRLGFTASVALRYGLFPMPDHLLDSQARRHFEGVFGRDAETIAEHWAMTASYLLDCADEAVCLC